MWMAGSALTFFCNAAYRHDTLGRYPWAWYGRGPVRCGRRSGRHRTADRPVLVTRQATDEGLLLFPGAVRLSRRRLSHLLYSSATRRRRRGGQDAVRGQRGHRPGDRRAADVDVARPASDPAWCAPRNRCSRSPPGNSAATCATLPFCLTPVRRRRCSLAGRALSGEPDGRLPPRPPERGPPTVRPLDGPSRGESATVRLDGAAFATLPSGDWPGAAGASPSGACCQQGGAPFGFLVAGLNRYRPLDEEYRLHRSGRRATSRPV